MNYLLDYVKRIGIAVKNEIINDIRAVKDRDPASGSALRILLTSPGVHAIILYRIAHLVYSKKFRLVAMMISCLARFFTGIEIHPAARIGKGLLIDHGMGVVIGETAEIGNDCTIFHGATLGGVGGERGKKRHPTLHDGVLVGTGAKVLGDIDIGTGAKIGANAVVINDVPNGATVVGIPARVLKK